MYVISVWKVINLDIYFNFEIADFVPLFSIEFLLKPSQFLHGTLYFLLIWYYAEH